MNDIWTARRNVLEGEVCDAVMSLFEHMDSAAGVSFWLDEKAGLFVVAGDEENVRALTDIQTRKTQVDVKASVAPHPAMVDAELAEVARISSHWKTWADGDKIAHLAGSVDYLLNLVRRISSPSLAPGDAMRMCELITLAVILLSECREKYIHKHATYGDPSKNPRCNLEAWNCVACGTWGSSGGVHKTDCIVARIDAALWKGEGLALPLAPAWRDMASAPRDGTPFDCWVAGHRLADCFWGKPSHTCLSEFCDMCPDDLNVECFRWSFGDEPIHPTHWMPEAAPPTTEEGGAG